MRVVIFLQNAWSPVYAGGVWARPSWLRALERSRSGKRLSVMISDLDLCENTTPIVGKTPSSVVPPDEKHIREIIARREPHIIVACGLQAEKAIKEIWDGNLIAVPHPAHRFVTDELYKRAGSLLKERFQGRIKLAQRKGYIETIQL